MRESGFDPSNRFGALNVDIIHYAPVCLNTLLYVMEDDAARIMETLGDRPAASAWASRAASRRDLINRLMWDEQAGLYYDYNIRTRRLRRYDFATTFYPLWAGIASPAQAARVRANLSGSKPPAAADEHGGHRQPVGRAVWLGAAADDCRRRPAALRLRR